MREKLLKKDNNAKNAEKYVGKYLDDLQHHFSLTNHQIVNILNNCITDLKRNSTEKKWWQLF